MNRLLIALVAILLLPTALFAATDPNSKAPVPAALATTGDAAAAEIGREAMAVHKGKEPTFIVRGNDPVPSEDDAAERGPQTDDEIDADFDAQQ